MTTLAALTARIRTRLDESTATMWTDAQLKEWVNDATRDIARVGEVVQALTTTAVTAGTQIYTGPTDALRIHMVRFYTDAAGSRNTLQYRDVNTMDELWGSGQVQGGGTPQVYTLWGTAPAISIILYPTPAQSGTLQIYYYRTPVPLATDGSADASEVVVPGGWEDLVVDYAEYNALRRDRDPRWQEAKALYDQHVEQMIVNTRRLTDEAGTWGGGDGWGGVPGWLSDPDGWGY